MSIGVIECTTDLIVFTSFAKSNGGIALQQQVQRKLQCSLADWIEAASIVIKKLVNDFKVSFPVTILLPDFALLTKSIKVPRVGSSKQNYIIKSHISQSLGLSGGENIQFVIRSSDENEIDVICSIVKQDWMESFSKSLTSIGDKIASIESAIVHYYNAFNLLFPLTIKNILLLTFHGSSVTCLFIGQNNLYIFKLQLGDNNFSLSLRELIAFHNNKHPDNIPEEVLVAGLNMNERTREFLSEVWNAIGLPIRLFSPLGDENASCLGSIGYAYAKLLNEGLFFDLTPRMSRRRWGFMRGRKALIIAGISVFIASNVLLVALMKQQEDYRDLIEAYEAKIIPLKKYAAIIEENEREVKLYEEGFTALENQLQSSSTWINFLNALQGILIKIPTIQIHSLKVMNPEPPVSRNLWKNEMMRTETVEPEFLESRELRLAGILHVEDVNQSSRHTIEDIKYLMNELTKLDFIEDVKNLHFDIKAFPNIPFSIIFVIKPQTL